MFKYCPDCKNKLEKEGYHYFCGVCGFDYYFNASPAAAVIILNNQKQMAMPGSLWMLEHSHQGTLLMQKLY